MIGFVAVGRWDGQAGFDDAAATLGDRLPVGSVYRLLADEGLRLFPDGYFADLFTDSRRGRPTVPARIVATVMLLQSYEGLSDREAVDRLAFDLRWAAAAGLPVAPEPFHPTVLVGMRNRLRASDRPRRLFEDVKTVARQAGLLRSRVRVLDSTPLFDAVATQDTVTQLRAAIRRLLTLADQLGEVQVAAAVRARLVRDDAYATPGKPPCDWDDPAAREQLVDALVRDALAALGAVEGMSLCAPLTDAAELVALVAGQDVEKGEDGVFRIVRKVAPDRTISTVDREARHGHKSRARRFDGYKTHLSVEPGSELIDEVAGSRANTADRDMVDRLLPDVPLPPADPDEQADPTAESEPTRVSDEAAPATPTDPDTSPAATPGAQQPWTVAGDSAYADGATLARLGAAGVGVLAKVPPARNSTGRFTKDRFTLDLAAGTVTCPAGQTTPIRPTRGGGGRAVFGRACATCPLAAQCTTARTGRVISIHRHETALQAARATQTTPAWQQTYRATRPGVERKISHFTRRPWGGRHARCRGLARITTDLDTRAGVLNLARLAVLGLRHTPTGWALS